MGFTKPVTVNGWQRLSTVMQTAGYSGSNLVSSIGFFNPDGTNLVYLHLTDNGVTNPATGTDGWPIGSAAGGAGNTFFSSRDANQSSLDLGTTWIFTATSVTFKILAVGN
jgi:hypothetical protein